VRRNENVERLSMRALATTVGLAVGMLVGAPANAAPAVPHYARCADLHQHYKHGVGRPGARDHVSGHTRPVTTFKVNRSLYNANKTLDRDHDGIACEQW